MARTTANSFGERIADLPVGTKHDSVVLSDGRTIRTGDIAVYEDRDIDPRDGVHSRIFVGEVEGVLDPRRGEEPELFISAGIGRIAVSEAEVSGEGSRVDPQTGLSKFIDQFLNRDCDELKVEWGDDIGSDGEDFRRQTA